MSTSAIHFPYHNPIFEYEGYFGKPSHCDLRIALDALEVALVIFTEVPSNRGTSVTNRLEHLATRVCHEFGLNPCHTVFFEHYPDRGYQLPETYRHVTYTWDDPGIAHHPKRERVALEDAQAILRNFGLYSL